jgi:hypothetical protein
MIQDVIFGNELLSFYMLLIILLIIGILNYRKHGNKECLYYFGASVALPYVDPLLSVVVILYLVIVTCILPDRK